MSNLASTKMGAGPPSPQSIEVSLEDPLWFITNLQARQPVKHIESCLSHDSCDCDDDDDEGLHI